MENKDNCMHKFGLIGKNIEYSFSRGYFKEKFEALKLTNHSYVNFDLVAIDEFKKVITNTKNLVGLNVTIPYKEAIIPFLNKLDPEAEKIGAVNTIKVTKNGTIGYNTDAYGFQKSLEPLLKKHHAKALILGTGGASKAIAYVLEQLEIEYIFVSRSKTENNLTYGDLTKQIISEHTLIINSSPVGTHPRINDKPDIPYQYIAANHYLFDLIYNPEKTAFLKAGEEQGAIICNGSQMLMHQAEKAWEIWNL